MHSFWSDGANFPEMIADWFKSHGYHFIAFTEHDRFQEGECWISTGAHQQSGQLIEQGNLLNKYISRFGKTWVEQRNRGVSQIRLKPLYEYRHLLEEPGKFLILNGEEVSVSWSGGNHWINIINAPQAIPSQSEAVSLEAIETTLMAAHTAAKTEERPVLIFLNHPNYEWNAVAEEIARARGLRFMEIYTALNSTNTYGKGARASVERIWDIVLTLRLSQPNEGEMLFGLATDDCHCYHKASVPIHPEAYSSRALPGRAWIMVHSEKLTPEYLIKAILQGDFYASTGVTLRSLTIDNRQLRLEVEPTPGVKYVTRFIGTLHGADLRSEPILDAEGKPLQTTRQYSNQIGMIFDEVEGVKAAYKFTGDELYVRAVVLSDEAHPNPTVPEEVTKAWTQPVPIA
ncbi:MAG: hypothetical protein PVG14_00020 [Anaerolineales bacterium]